jgi:coproporphyrinogen III oxidase-like Fe-S oxidoreductase
MARAQKFISQGLLTQEGENIRLTKKGLFVSDSIMADFMYV